MQLNEQIVRKAYQLAEVQDIDGFVALFTEDGTIRDESSLKDYGGETLGGIITEFSRAFPDMHRELYDLHVCGDVVVVELSLNGTHNGPMEMPGGTIAGTGKTIHTPCCDVWRLKNGKIRSFHCYNSATVILAQLGVLTNMQASFADHRKA